MLLRMKDGRKVYEVTKTERKKLTDAVAILEELSALGLPEDCDPLVNGITDLIVTIDLSVNPGKSDPLP